MRVDKYTMAQSWMRQDDATPEEAKATWDTLETEFEDKRKSWLMASAETDEIIKTINDKFGPGTLFPASEAPIPPMTDQQAIMEWENRNRKADGGQLVAPSVDGLRPGYAGEEKYITPLRRKGFTGSKFNSVADPTYSDGRRRVKTKAYEAWLKEQHAKDKPDWRFKRTVRPELDNYLIEIAEAMQEADNTQDFEYLMRNKEASKKLEKQQAASRKKAGKKVYKQKVYPKGMLSLEAIKVLENLETDPVNLKIIADSLGEDTDWVLEILDERNQYVWDVKGERALAKDDPKYKKPRNDYLKVENWLQKNAKKYSTPQAFEKALIKRFGNKNQFIMDMKSPKNSVTTYFSPEFKKLMLNSDSARTMIKPFHLKQLISSSLYNYNDKIKTRLTNEIRKIFTSENLPKLRTEARKMIRNNPLFKMFGLDKTITGPFPRVIQAEIGKKLWDDFRAFRNPRANTYEMLKAFEDLVPPEFKGMFKEAASAILDAQQNQWPEAKKKLGIADKIAWDHKVPASIIDKGYADIIEYTKVNPVDYEWNSRFKNAKFDTPINKLITKFENAPNIENKKKIVEEMITKKNKFSEKAGGYLDEVNINFNEKTGELKFSSSAKPLTRKMDATAMLEKSQKQISDYITGKSNKRPMLSSGLAGAYEYLMDEPAIKALINSEGFKKFSKVAKTPGKFFGIGDLALGYLDFRNNKQKGQSDQLATKNALQAMSFGLWKGGDRERLEEVKELAVKNGMDGDVFDSITYMNDKHNLFQNTINNAKFKYDDFKKAGMDVDAEQIKIDAGKRLTEIMGDITTGQSSLQTNVRVAEAGAPININVDDKMLDAYKDVRSAGIDYRTQQAKEAYDTQKRLLHPEAGKIGNWLMTNIFTTDARKKAQEQAYIDDMEERELFLYNRARGISPDQPLSGKGTVEFMLQNPELFGHPTSYFDGGIASLRRKK